MTLPAGTKIGPHQILGSLGEGGMGEVYRATDTRLKRQVAIKILPAALAAEPDRLARFQREAEVLASLNHPHIAALYGLEEAADVKALVMELVEGPTLADRIAQGPLPIDEAVPIARQIAAALEAAHEQGIIHRDLKPANIKVKEDGTVKVLDFGLAKLTESGMTTRSGRDDSAHAATLTSPATRLRQGSGAAGTEMGMILGTAAYMSPEQARGRVVDKRTDIWAFGAVLYEMLTGVRAFGRSTGSGQAGDDITDVIAEVVKTTPNWAALPADVPAHVVTLIQQCLEKDRQARISDIAVARFLLSSRSSAGGSAPAITAPVMATPAPRWRHTIPWVLAAVLAGAALGWLLPRRTGGAPSVTHLQMDVAPAERLSGAIASVRPARTAMALAPDGRTVVFAGMRGDVTQLFARALDRAEATPLPGTEGATGPFFSPDGVWIGFWAGSTLKKVPAAGGPPAVIGEVSIRTGTGASWGDDGTIYFESNGIFKVSSAEGKAVAVTTPDAATRERHLLPHALPGGKALLHTSFVSGWESANIVLHSLETGEHRVLVHGGADARLVGTNHLVYMKSGMLMGVPFDTRSLQVMGEPVALIENVMQGVNASNSGDETGAGQFTVSSSGTLLYATGGINKLLESSLVWVDRKGAEQPVQGAPVRSYLFPRLSRDGQKIAVAVRDGTNRGTDLWVYDTQRGTPTRLTFDGGGAPVWTPDGTRLVFNTATPGNAPNLHAIDAGGGGKPERLTTSEWAQQPASSGSNMIVFLQRPQKDTTGIWVLPLNGDRKPRLFLESRFGLMHPAMSPDGRWIAYVSDESGSWEVYVQPYPGPGAKTRISTAGGSEPIWTANGRELIYRSATRDARQFLSVTIRSVSPFQPDAPRLLFEAKPGEYDATSPVRSWDVSADGQRFLLARYGPSTDKPVTTMHVVLNWTEELKRLAR